jgi:hypothetical protein
MAIWVVDELVKFHEVGVCGVLEEDILVEVLSQVGE